MHIFCARFLSVLLTESRLHVGDLDGLIKRNAFDLTQACWRLFHPSLSLLVGMRIRLLLRVASVDPEPFEKILGDLRDNVSWQERYEAMDSLINVLAEAHDASVLDRTTSTHLTMRCVARAIMRFVGSYLWDEQVS
ncbi:hypothetical protein CROQUDRAFT_625723 [Cronartium quercuum f. sp. fusiforme G11]|uniref:Uncharacterized protein n=1 Tax=Cronartium quercuum f. sp. fusiforme G11 TaxID=708437 RepID=A0A9P6NHV1_9BASI|nr:hypothetical protein CROQUDRAFT_625723 [Cronartium quercuum f. sp. fusiforme G11]